MSTEKKLKVNRVELKVMIVREFGRLKNFCNQYDINYQTFLEYMRGREDLPKLNRKIVGIMLENGYDPYKETEKPTISKARLEEIHQLINKTYNSMEA